MTTRLLTLSNRRLLHCRTFSNRFLPQSTNHIPNKFRRALSSQTTSTIPKSPIKVLSSPTLEELEKGDFEVEIVPEDQVELTLTDRAAEVRRCQWRFTRLTYSTAITGYFISRRESRFCTSHIC